MEDKGKRSYLLVLVGLSFLFLILGVGLYISSKLIANRVTGEPPLQNGDITGPSKRPPIDSLKYPPKPGDPHYPEPLKTQRYTIDEKFTDSLAYLEDGDIYLFDKNGKRKLTEGGNVKQFKWTRSGEEITYLINEVDETKGGGRSVIFRLNVETTEKMVGVEKEIVCEEVKSEFGGDYTRCPQIEDFDLSPDSERLAYGFRGLWVKELNSGTEEQLVKEEISPSPGGTAYLYNPIKVKYNPTREILLLSYSGYEGNTWDQVYDLTTKTTLEIEGMPTSNAPDWIHWTDDEKIS